VGVTSNCGLRFFLQAILYSEGQIKFSHQYENKVERWVDLNDCIFLTSRSNLT